MNCNVIDFSLLAIYLWIIADIAIWQLKNETIGVTMRKELVGDNCYWVVTIGWQLKTGQLSHLVNWSIDDYTPVAIVTIQNTKLRVEL